MDLKYIEIQNKYLPSIYKYIDFKDRKFIYKKRIRKGYFEPIKFFTEKKHKTKEYPDTSRNVLIQNIKRNVLFFDIFFKENFDYRIWELTEKITIIDVDKKQYDCKFDSVNIEEIENTTLSKVTVFFEIIETDDFTISSFLTSDFIDKKGVGYYYLELTNNKYISYSTDDGLDLGINFPAGESLIFKTLIKHETKRITILENFIKDKFGNDILINSVDCEELTALFFLTDNELKQLNRYGRRCFYTLNRINYGVRYIYGSQTFRSEVNLIFEVTESEMINCNKVEVKLRYNFINHTQ